MKKLPRSTILLISIILTFVSCGSNVKNTNSSKNTNENELKENYNKTSKVTLLNLSGIKEVKHLPKEIENIKNGALIFNKNDVTIFVVSSYSSIDEATNNVLKKNDITDFIFKNFVNFEKGKESNKEYTKDVDISKYILKEDFNFEKSYILEFLENGKKKFKVVSIYKSTDENFERNIISAWEGICWDKEINLNITEKFIRLIVSNYEEIKKIGKITLW